MSKVLRDIVCRKGTREIFQIYLYTPLDCNSLLLVHYACDISMSISMPPDAKPFQLR